jgi:hypothetical protein
MMFKRILHIVVTAWRILFTLTFIFSLLALGIYALVFNDQGLDFFIGVITHNFPISYLIISTAFLLLWCLLCWYACRIVLQVKMLDVDPDDPFALRLIVWIPRIIGLIPLLIVAGAMIRAAGKIPNERWFTLTINLLVLIGMGILLMIFFMKRAKLAEALHIDFAPAHQRYTAARTPLKRLWSMKANRIAFRSILIAVAVMIAPFFFLLKFGYARMLGPATVLLAGFIFFTLVLTLIVLFINFRRSPAFLLIGGYIILASTCNNNSAVRLIPATQTVQRETIRENFIKWIQPKMQSTDSVVTIYLVAAEGGGIRAATFTSVALKRMEELQPGFMDKVYAISGVSGGGVGSCFYAAYRKDQLSGVFDGFPSSSTAFDETVSADFLSSLTAAFVFHDNLQRVIPFPIEGLSRNNKLEDSWAWSYEKHLFAKTMDQPFLDLWQHAKGKQVPNLFINGLLAETGQKTIVSNLMLSDSIFKDDIDVLRVLGQDVAVKTAASLCSRFPLITSGALISIDRKQKGHIVDGGYKENSGIETAWQLAIALNNLIDETELAHRKKIKVHLLFIRNSNTGENVTDNQLRAVSVLPDLTTIIPGFLNAWDRRTETHINISKELFNEGTLRARFHYSQLSLNNRNKLLPLGWYLSEDARNNIIRQVNDSLKAGWK